jgi:3-phenylpropionate/trans-cinnamate dioxygenase ferredoxin subunit
MEFVKAASISEVPAGKMKKVKVGENEVLIANVGGKYYAIGNRCTHAGGSLSEGLLEGNVVTCPKHG